MMYVYQNLEIQEGSNTVSGGGGARDARPPSGPNFLHFHAVFEKNWSNNRLAPPPFGGSAPSSGKSWIRHWLCTTIDS